ncbi:MAG TPA: nitrous oxide reductase accessory protein NosL [Candidatus Nitrosotenuis sp.]|nr:nitrous oxide reductase accessory protein NosL [Candidatus Nitrosotenuis sp.]
MRKDSAARSISPGKYPAPGSLALAALVLLFLGGCASAPRDAGPPELRLGHDVCARCGMAIDEARFAAALVGQEEPRLFDDIGCLLESLREQPPPSPTRLWVHDFASGEWVEAGAAYYVLGVRVATPMGYALVAFAHREGALALALEKGGKVCNFEEVSARFRGPQSPRGGKP